jgi:hypothetical protein
MKYQNPQLETSGRGLISDCDKKAIKFNMRKLDLFEKAFNFGATTFELGNLVELMTEE